MFPPGPAETGLEAILDLFHLPFLFLCRAIRDAKGLSIAGGASLALQQEFQRGEFLRCQAPTNRPQDGALEFRELLLTLQAMGGIFLPPCIVPVPVARFDRIQRMKVGMMSPFAGQVVEQVSPGRHLEEPFEREFFGAITPGVLGQTAQGLLGRLGDQVRIDRRETPSQPFDESLQELGGKVAGRNGVEREKPLMKLGSLLGGGPRVDPARHGAPSR
jgi:hypothetical protein